MFATVISLTLSFFGANPILDAEPAVSEFRNVREIAEETQRAAILEEQQRPLKELAVANEKLDRASSVQHDALFQLPIATVNGQVITGADVLGRYSGVLKQIRESSHPEGYPQMVRTLIERDLQKLISQTIQEQAYLSRLTKEQRAEVEVDLDRQFSSEVEKLKRELRVESEPELLAALMERGTTLNQVRSSYRRERIAMEHTVILFKPNENESEGDAKKRRNRKIDELVSRADVRTAFNWKPVEDKRDGVPAAPKVK